MTLGSFLILSIGLPSLLFSLYLPIRERSYLSFVKNAVHERFAVFKPEHVYRFAGPQSSVKLHIRFFRGLGGIFFQSFFDKRGLPRVYFRKSFSMSALFFSPNILKIEETGIFLYCQFWRK